MPEDNPTDTAKLTDDDILTQARKEFEIADEGERQPRDEYQRCMRFVALDQYPESGSASVLQRTSAGLPSLVIDNLGPICDQIINDWIRNRMGIQIAPADATATEKTAKIMSGYTRNLEYLSRGRLHYDSAFRQMVRGGRGHIGLLTRRKPGTFRQELYIRGFPDAQAVYMDPFATELDLSDNDFTFVRSVKSRDNFKREEPDAKETDFDDWGSDFVDWLPEDGVVVAEYWKASYRLRKLQKLTKKIRLTRGSQVVLTDEVYDDEYAKLPRGVAIATNPEDGGALWEENEDERVITFRKITGREILQTTTWKGKIIPIVPMIARMMIVDGKKKIFSAISRSIDPQCQLNYAESGIAEELGTTVRTPYIGALGAFKSQRKAWQNANIERFSFLEYDPVVVGDKLAPPPSRQPHEPQIMALALASDRAQNNIRRTSGLNQTSLGEPDNTATSGIAKKVQKVEGDNSTFDFPAAGCAALEMLGMIIVDVAPKILTEAEVIQILNEDEKQERVLINGDPATFPGAPKDQEDAHYLDRGEYKVRVSAAPSHQTMREETEEKLMGIYAEAPEPQKAALMAPMIRTMTFTGKDEIADRVELPEYRKPQDGETKIPPEVRAVIEQGQQLIQAGQQHIALLERERDSKILEFESKKEIEAMRNETQIAIARIAQETKTGITAFEAEIESIKHMLDMIMSQQQMGHEEAESQAARDHAVETQAADQQHQAQLQDSAQSAAAEQAEVAAKAVTNGGPAE